MATGEKNSDANGSTAKTIYLIRHAESEENRRLASLRTCFGSIAKFSLPSSEDMYASVGLLNIAAQVDSDVSEIGIQQIEQVGAKLKQDKFLIQQRVTLVAHSPLKRARQTSEGMLDCAAPDKKAPSVERVEELDLLIEKTPSEWLPGYGQSFADRIGAFESWLGEQPELAVAIVGHSQFFKAMLGLPFKFGNCEVWELRFDPSATVPVVFGTSDKPTSGDAADYILPRGWSAMRRLYTFQEATSASNESQQS